MTDDLLPFGKYRGRPIRDVAMQDPQYLQWLMQQQWFGEKFSHLIQVVQVTNNFAVMPEKTPEHNAMQAKFLDPRLQRRVVEISGVIAGLVELCERGIKSSTMEEAWAERLSCLTDVEWEITNTEFERFADVVLWVDFPKLADHYKQYYTRGGCRRILPGLLSIECKPSMGGDYPAVLRQIQRGQMRKDKPMLPTRWVLIIEQYSGTTVPYESVREIFKASRVYIFREDEIQP